MKVSFLLPDTTNVVTLTVVADGDGFYQNVSVSGWVKPDIRDGAVLRPAGFEEEDHDNV